MSISDIKTFIKQLVLLVSPYELLMSFRSSRKRPPSIVLPWGRLQERILVSDRVSVKRGLGAGAGVGVGVGVGVSFFFNNVFFFSLVFF